ncbi:hypothetical protein K3181_12915 [Qipengyuania sp. YG27]|uniref:Uncharacterized protein n=1 Tax=Qipengyuania mesophila TaxID=2867246 RepID=A0ABS7JXH2_9SPHN|nr:hypothetical protein [Qipengyuania mesophila]MBX7502346.1 hypothetical protein [Qipengyuania mesophila]
MFALFLTALLVVTAVAVAGVLADSGLRWWSAFGALRRELKGETVQLLPALRPAISLEKHSAFGRCGAIGTVDVKVSRAA